jgi:hypothetical protein
LVEVGIFLRILVALFSTFYLSMLLASPPGLTSDYSLSLSSLTSSNLLKEIALTISRFEGLFDCYEPRGASGGAIIYGCLLTAKRGERGLMVDALRKEGLGGRGLGEEEE